MSRRTEICPTCKGPVLPVAYGLPSPELFEASEEGAVFLGGCVVGDDDVMERCECGAIQRRTSEVPSHGDH